jgi:hypothetical protein
VAPIPYCGKEFVAPEDLVAMLAQEQQQLKLAVDQPDPTSVHDDAARLGINSDPTDGDIVDRGRRRGRRRMALRNPQAKVDFRRWCGRHENIVDLPPAVDITETALRDDRKDGVRVGVAPEAPANRSSRHEICTRIERRMGAPRRGRSMDVDPTRTRGPRNFSAGRTSWALSSLLVTKTISFIGGLHSAGGDPDWTDRMSWARIGVHRDLSRMATRPGDRVQATPFRASRPGQHRLFTC